MPVEITITPIKNLIFPGEKLYTNRDEEEDDIQAIRLYRSRDPSVPASIVGSDIFIIEESIKAKISNYSQMEAAAEAATTNSIMDAKTLDAMPFVHKGSIRKMRKVHLSLKLE
jgi:hypothetical protein